jgi:hypothetical protein
MRRISPLSEFFPPSSATLKVILRRTAQARYRLRNWMVQSFFRKRQRVCS